MALNADLIEWKPLRHGERLLHYFKKLLPRSYFKIVTYNCGCENKNYSNFN